MTRRKAISAQSYIYKRSTLEVVLAKFPASFELVLAASLIVILFAVPAGVYCAVKPALSRRKIDSRA